VLLRLVDIVLVIVLFDFDAEVELALPVRGHVSDRCVLGNVLDPDTHVLVAVHWGGGGAQVEVLDVRRHELVWRRC
jgi:hypothetical protein